MNICIFDTETTNLEKPFCYNIGYIIGQVANDTIYPIVSKDFIVEQVWHNPMLFSTAYYADKRPIYVSAMKGRRTAMDKFGYICQEMIRDFKAYNIEHAYAYNSPFDEKVFEFNCDWFKCNNPFDTIKIHDIRGYAIKELVDSNYHNFCETNQLFTESMNYSTTAETMYKYLTGDISYEEEHTALRDSEDEMRILNSCLVTMGEAALLTDISVPKCVPRNIPRTFNVIDTINNVVNQYSYNSIIIAKDKSRITLR